MVRKGAAREFGEVVEKEKRGDLQKSARLSVLYDIGGDEGEDWGTYI